MSRKEIKMRKFKKVYVEITNVCNLSCSFCPKNEREKRFMNRDEYIQILKKIKPYTKYIYFHLMGEPLLSNNLEEFLDIANEMDFKVNLTTNGTLLLKNKSILLNSKALRQINVSLHSFEANCSEISFENYFLDAVKFILEASEKTDIICSMRLWNLDNNNLKGDNKLNNSIINMLKSNFEYEGDLKEILEKYKKVKLKEKIYLNSAEKFSWPDINRQVISDTGFCHGLRDHFGILVDGTVVPCCLDSEGNIPLGNIFEQELEYILEAHRAKKMYDEFSGHRKVEELCKKCGYSEKFN